MFCGKDSASDTSLLQLPFLITSRVIGRRTLRLGVENAGAAEKDIFARQATWDFIDILLFWLACLMQ